MGCCGTKRRNINISLTKRVLPTGLPSRNSVFGDTGRQYSFLKTRNGKVSDYFSKLKKIGSGGFGTVHRAIQRATKIPRAIKILPKKLVKLNSILTEVQHLRELVSIMQDHPNIMKVYEIIEQEENFIISTELCNGPNLFEKIQRLKNFTENDAAKFMLQIFSALSHCHRANIVHRDIKPENLLFQDSSEDSLLKIIDFGISNKQLNSNRLSEAIGTVLIIQAYYIAPEILSRRYNQKCDMWSCGVLLYIMLSGQFPFKGVDTSNILVNVKIGLFSLEGELWDAISPGAKDLVKCLLTKNPNDRISAEQAYNHPWTQQQSRWFIKNLKLNAQYLKRLEKFRIHCSFSKAAMNFIATQLTSSDETSELRALFLKLDTDGDGILSKQELLEGYRQAQLSTTDIGNLLKQCNGEFIEYTDFLIATFDWERQLTVEKLRRMFQNFSDNGVITQAGVSAIFGSLNLEGCEEIMSHLESEGAIGMDQFIRIMKSAVLVPVQHTK